MLNYLQIKKITLLIFVQGNSGIILLVQLKSWVAGSLLKGGEYVTTYETIALMLGFGTFVVGLVSLVIYIAISVKKK